MLTTACSEALRESALLACFGLFVQIAGDIGALGKKKQAGVGEGNCGRVCVPGVSEHSKIEAERLDTQALQTARDKSGIEVKGSTSIAIMLAAKASEIQNLVVCDDCAWSKAKRVVFPPATTDVAILCCGKREGFIKTAQRQQGLARECKIVAAEEGESWGVLFV